MENGIQSMSVQDILELTYEKFLELAKDRWVMELINEGYPTLAEKEIWSKYLDPQIQCYSKYAGLPEIGDGYISSTAQIANALASLDGDDPAKVHIRNFVNRIITSSDYKMLGLALNNFIVFVSACHFEDQELMVHLFEFFSDQEVPVHLRVITCQSLVEVFKKSKGFQNYAEMLFNLPHNQKIKNKVLAIHRRSFVWKKSDFLKHAYNYYVNK